MPCLSCNHSINVWEDVCGECGVRQSETLQRITAECQSTLAQAETLARDYRFDEALHLIEGVASLHHPRLATQAKRAAELSAQVQDQLATHIADRERLYEMANADFRSARYEAAIKGLESIPEPLRDEKTDNLLDTCEMRIAEGEQLYQEIATCFQARRYADLEVAVQRFLLIHPEHAKIQNLQRQLADWRDKLQKRQADLLARIEKLCQDCKFAEIEKTLTLFPKEMSELPRVQELRQSVSLYQDIVKHTRGGGVFQSRVGCPRLPAFEPNTR